VWGTKWWPHLQFTFICSINSPRAKKETAESQLEFHKRLANKMLNNKLDGEGNCPNSPVRPRKRSRESLENEHRFMTRPNFTGSWNKKAQAFAQVKTKYSKLECATCKFPCRTYCAYNKEVAMCQDCFGEPYRSRRFHVIVVNYIVDTIFAIF
jgi:hypothetical protein